MRYICDPEPRGRGQDSGTSKERNAIHGTIRRADVCPAIQMGHSDKFVSGSNAYSRKDPQLTLFYVVKEGANVSFEPVTLVCLQLKIIFMPEWGILGWPTLIPCSSNRLNHYFQFPDPTHAVSWRPPYMLLCLFGTFFYFFTTHYYTVCWAHFP